MTIDDRIKEITNEALQPVLLRLVDIELQIKDSIQPKKQYLTRIDIKKLYGISKYRIMEWERNLLLRGTGKPKLYKREDIVKLMEEVL